MEFEKILFLFFELMVVINSSYSYVPRRSNTLRNRNLRQSTNPQKCEKLVLENGSVRQVFRGKIARFVCHPDFDLVGFGISSCVQGQWTNPIPICTKPGCLPVATPPNSYIIMKSTSIMLFCRKGHSVAGSQETFCNGKTWDRSLGVCRENQASPAMSCDFEVSDRCGWEPDTTHDFEWKRKNGYTSMKQTQTGPQHDNTVGIPLEGHFMLATLATPSLNSVARLISPLYPAATSKAACFRFYYHMYGATTCVLRIYIKPESLTIAEMLREPKYLLMTKDGSYENAWFESVFNIDEYDQDFEIIIEATSALANRSNIAIDDVALLSGSECVIEESKSTAVTPEDGGIYFEQSCINRCEETSSHSRYATESTLTSGNKRVNMLLCDCFDGCVDLMSCCLDYESVCVFGTTTMISGAETTTTIPINPIINPMLTTSTLPPAKQIPSVLMPSNMASTSPIIPVTKSASTTSTLAPAKQIPTTVTPSNTVSTPPIIPVTKTASTISTLAPAKQIPTTVTPSNTVSTPPIIPVTKTALTTSTLAPAKQIPTTVTPSNTVSTPPIIPVTKTALTISTLAPAKQIPTTLTPSSPVSKSVTISTGPTKRPEITIEVEAIDVRFLSPESTVSSITSTMKNSQDATDSTYVTERKPISGSDDDPVKPSTNSTATKLLMVFGIMLILAAIVSVIITSFKVYMKKSSVKDNSDKVRFVSVGEQVDFST